MGNWMRLSLTGSCDESEVGALRDVLVVDLYGDVDSPAWKMLGPLSISESLCGLGDWPAAVISDVGNAFERDYTAECVRSQLARLAKIAPSLALTVHCGGDFESADCVATVKAKEGTAEILPPEVKALPEISEDAAMGRLFKTMGGLG